jgi:predicted GIY-YIG superfamily endonuclease
LCYTLLSADGRCTYVGVTNNLARRLRQHNGLISGGAKCTGREGKRPWSVVCTVTGFVTYVEALQFEWALHHAGRRWGSGLPGRWRKLEHVCGKERWTSTSPLATERPLMLTLFTNDTVPPLPPHITVKQSQTLFPV